MKLVFTRPCKGCSIFAGENGSRAVVSTASATTCCAPWPFAEGDFFGLPAGWGPVAAGWGPSSGNSGWSDLFLRLAELMSEWHWARIKPGRQEFLRL